MSTCVCENIFAKEFLFLIYYVFLIIIWNKSECIVQDF